MNAAVLCALLVLTAASRMAFAHPHDGPATAARMQANMLPGCPGCSLPQAWDAADGPARGHHPGKDGKAFAPLPALGQKNSTPSDTGAQRQADDVVAHGPPDEAARRVESGAGLSKTPSQSVADTADDDLATRSTAIILLAAVGAAGLLLRRRGGDG
jgi:hypothetical protein